MFKHGHKQCLQAELKQCFQAGHKHLHVRTDGTYEEVTHLKDLSNCLVTRAKNAKTSHRMGRNHGSD